MVFWLQVYVLIRKTGTAYNGQGNRNMARNEKDKGLNL